MACRGGGHGGRGDRGDPRPPYGRGTWGEAPGGGDRPSGFEWPPPAPTPRPVPQQYQAAPMGYRAPMAMPHHGDYALAAPPAVVYRAPMPQAIYAPPPAPVPVTIRALPPAPSPAPAPRQVAQGASASSAAPSAAALAKEAEKKLFVSETALAPSAAAAAAAVAASQGPTGAAEDAPDVDLARPGHETVGEKVMVRANHFLVDVADNNLFHYDVSINPESKSRATNREVLNELIKLHGKTSLGGKLPAYDGRKSLYTAGSLPFESEEFVVTLVDPEKKDKERAEREYKITIRIAGRTDLYHLQQFLRGRQRDMPQETIQVLDVVLRESPSWNYVTVSRSFFSTSFGHRGDIGERLECWRGYYQSLRPTQMGLSLNIDISATSFFKPVTVIKFVEEFLCIRDTSRPLSDRDRAKIKKALRGVRIETSHQQDQIRRYKITGITPIPMGQLIFPVDEQGTRKTVVQYFWEKYNYRLKYASWPCLQTGSDSRPVYLPMEVCKIVEGQRSSKKLNDRQVTNILRATCKRPQERKQSIRDMVLHNKYAEDRFAQEFGIKVCNDLVSVPARVLPPPMLKYHDSGREKTCAPSVGQWNIINNKMINGGTIDNWTCLNFSRMRPEEVQRFCMDLIHMCNATGMAVNPMPFVEVRSAAPNNIENALRDVHRRAAQMLVKQGTGNQLQLLIVILPEVSGSYGKIKRVCETDIGIVSQCFLPKHASRPNKQYLENVALKINVKVGGRNTVLERAFVCNGIPFALEVQTIIFGADVTHPPPGEDSALSIAAAVASMDWPEITKYMGLVSAQPHHQEIIEDLFSVSKDPQKGHNVNGGMIRELLIAFRRKTNRRPERIIFYRDGVCEGQFSHVLLHEMDAIRKACASLEEGYVPLVTFVVVQKSHHTRLLPEVHGRRDMTDKSGSILPGTVVDQKICHPTEFDLYLCSHAGIQGTSRPTHYHVLYDENHFTADALQSLTNNLCYTQVQLSSFDARRCTLFYVSQFTSDRYHLVKCSYARCTPAVSVGKVNRVSEINVGILSLPGEGTASSTAAMEILNNEEGSSVSNVLKICVVEVHILNYKIKVSVLENSCLDAAIEKAMSGLNIWVSDFYLTGPHGVIRMDSAVHCSCEVFLNPRLRGGSGRPPSDEMPPIILHDTDFIPLKEIITKLRRRKGSKWLERVDIPHALRKATDMAPWVVNLGTDALLVFSLIMDCYERTHSELYCFEGQIELEDLYYLPKYKIVVVHERVRRRRLTDQGYTADMKGLVRRILVCFQYYANGSWHFPSYMEDLVNLINKLDKQYGWGFSKASRSIIFNHAAGWTSARRVNTFTLVSLFFKGLTHGDQKAFEWAMEMVSLERDGWQKDVKGSYSAPAMQDVFYHQFWNGEALQRKNYSWTVAGQIDFTRCLVTHAIDHYEFSVKKVDAALARIWVEQIQDIQTALLLHYRPPSKRKDDNKDDVKKGKRVALTSDILDSERFSVNMLPKTQDFEVFEILGLPNEP